MPRVFELVKRALGESREKGTDWNPAPGKKGSPTGGLVILGAIVVVCVVLACYLSTLMPAGRQPPIEEIVRAPQNPTAQAPGRQREPVEGIAEKPPTGDEGEAPVSSPGAVGEGVVEKPEVESTERRPPEEIDAVNAQVRGLGSVSDAITSFRLLHERYPEDIDEVVQSEGLEFWDNPYRPGTPVEHVAPGGFSPGGFTYLPSRARRGGPVEGFVLIGYADKLENGVTISEPLNLVWPYVFDPPINTPLRGVALAMGEDRALIELSEFM
jgi:hypothetical protein